MTQKLIALTALVVCVAALARWRAPSAFAEGSTVPPPPAPIVMSPPPTVAPPPDPVSPPVPPPQRTPVPTVRIPFPAATQQQDDDDEASRSPTRTPRQTTLDATLWSAGLRAALYAPAALAPIEARILADGWIPVSAMYVAESEGERFFAQKAEHMTLAGSRIYYSRGGQRATIRMVSEQTQAPSMLNQLLFAAAEEAQTIYLNADAALHSAIARDGYAVSSPEFVAGYAGVDYVGQQAVDVATGSVRVYYVEQGDWTVVRSIRDPDAHSE